MLFAGDAGLWPHRARRGRQRKRPPAGTADGRKDRILTADPLISRMIRAERPQPFGDHASGLRVGLRRAVRFRRPVAAFRHKLVKLGFVLGVPQAIEEVAELALLLLKAAQGLGAVLVEGVVAAGTRMTPPFPAAWAHFSAHAVHLLLHALHLALPTVHAVITPAAHSSAPDDEGQRRKAQRPPETKPEDHESDPGGPSQLVQLCNDRHDSLTIVNV